MRSLTSSRGLAGGTGFPVPETLYPRGEQSRIVLAGAKESALAHAVLSFITGEEGRSILGRYGSGLP